jgi:exonuclease III
MKILSWNIRGLNGKIKHHILKKNIDKEQPTIIMLQETKCNRNLVSSISSKLWKGSHAIAIETQRVVGDLVIISNPIEISLTTYLSTPRTIFAHFHLIGSIATSILTNLYGPQVAPKKNLFLNSIQSLKVIIGDKH